MQGWVIVYLPGGDVYQMVGTAVHKQSRTKRLIQKGVRAIVAAAQVYWWFKT